jgi:hypothetical protein
MDLKQQMNEKGMASNTVMLTTEDVLYIKNDFTIPHGEAIRLLEQFNDALQGEIYDFLREKLEEFIEESEI